MKVSEALGRWLNDPPSQLETKERIEAFGKTFRGSGAMAELGRDLDQAPEGDASAILDIGRDFLDRPELFDDAVAAMVRAAAVDPFFRPPLRRVFSPVHLGLLLVDSPKLSLLLALTLPESLAAKRMSGSAPASITFGGQSAAFKFLKAGGATLSFWEASPIEQGFSSGTAGRCRKVATRRIEDGESFTLDGRRETFVIDHAESPIVYAQAVTPIGASTVSVEYDSRSLEFAGASSTDEIGSRVQMMVSLLRLLDRRDAALLIRECLESPHFYVRWHVMREFLALDAELALPSLRDMAESDPHPEVRAAAAQTLAAFFDDEESSDREDTLCRA